MMSVIQIHLENITVLLLLKTNFYCIMRMLKLHNTYFLLACFYRLLFDCVYVTLFFLCDVCLAAT